MWRGIRLYSRGVRVRGTVVELRGGPLDEGLRPVVEFTGRDGVVRRVWMDQGYAAAVGQDAWLVYDPDDPDRPEWRSVTLLIAVPAFVVAVGVAAALAAAGVATGLIDLN